MTKRRRQSVAVFLGVGVFITVVLLLFQQCGEIDRRITGTYWLYETNPGTISIHRELRDGGVEILVAALVRRYAAVRDGEYIVGLVIETDRWSELKDEECPGWFIISTKDGSVVCGLSEGGWISKLVELGIDPDSVRLRTVRSKNLVWN